MDDVDRLLKSTVAELEKLLSPRNVLGEPIERGGVTVIPIVSFGFGFGAGGGTGAMKDQSGGGSGTGAGGGIRPVGAIVIDAAGARIEPLPGTAATLAEAIGNTVTQVVKARSGSAKSDDVA